MSKKILDIGCGKSKHPGAIGVDSIKLDNVDVIHDLDIFPWPFDDDEFEVIYANHYLEHVSNIVNTLKEIHRISTNKAVINIRVPHYASDNYSSDLTHKVRFGYRSFNHFSINGDIDYDYYSDFKFEILFRRIKFMGPHHAFDPFRSLGIEWLVNKIPRLYERFFVYLLPPAEIIFKLRILKD